MSDQEQSHIKNSTSRVHSNADKDAISSPLVALVSAFELLTIVPIGKLLNTSSQKHMGPLSTVFYPLVGLFIGLSQTVLVYVLLLLFQDCGIVARLQILTTQGQIDTYTPLSYLGFVVIAACAGLLDVILTRFMHYDALADVIDARFGSFDKTKRLQILKDPRCGAFGVTAIVLRVVLVIVMVSLLIPQGVYAALIPVCMLSRCAAMNTAWTGQPLFAEGIGHSVSGKPSGMGQAIGWLGCAVGFVLLIILSKVALEDLSLSLLFELRILFGTASFLSFIALCFVLGGIPRLIARGFDGVNGDVLGASVSICEVITLFIGLLLAYY